MIGACWYANNRDVYAYQGNGRQRLVNDPKVCVCASKDAAEHIVTTHNSALSVTASYLATRIVPRAGQR